MTAAPATVATPTTTTFGVRYGILAFLCVSAAIAYIQRAAMSVPAAEIADQLNFENLATGMGRVQSAFYLGYALMQLPSGWLADRLGSRIALALYCALWSLFTFLSGLAWNETSLIALWGLMGVMQAGAFPCATKAIGQLFPEGERARASGLLASGMGLGGALAPAATGLVLIQLSPWEAITGWQRWQMLLMVLAIPGFLWSLSFVLFVSAKALPATALASGSAAQLPASRFRWSRLVTSGSLWLLCAQQFFRAAAMVFFLTWFPTFLQQTRGVSQIDSAWMTSIAGMGAVVGSLLGGFASDELLRRTGNHRLSRQGLAVLGMSLCAVLIVASYFVADVQASMVLITLGAFFATFGGVSGYTVAIKFGGRHVATVFSTMNMCGNFGASLFPIAAGWLVAQTGNWNLILFFFAGIMAVDAVCWALLNPRGTLFQDELQEHELR